MRPSVMPYARDVSNLTVQPSVFFFPGDEAVRPSAYAAAMKNTYLRKVPLANSLMKRFGVPYDEEDQERIKRLMVAMGWLDHLLDEAPDRATALEVYKLLIGRLQPHYSARQAPEWVRPELLDSIILLSNAVKTLPPKHLQLIVEKALRIGAISSEKAAVNGPKRYVAILKEEGELSSDLTIECLSPKAKTSANYPKLHTWNKQAIIAATLLDAAKDIRQDYADGLTHVKPTTANKAYIFGKALVYTPAVLSGLGLRGIQTMLKVGVN